MLMASSALNKVNTITQIVRLRQVVRRWKTKSLTRPGSHRRTPSGSIAIYVGPELRRFVIPTRFLNLPVFLTLLHEAEEEFGFQTAGGLSLPCEPGFFREILRLLEEDEDKYRGLGLDEFLKMVSEVGLQCYEQTFCKDHSSCLAFTPLLQKTRV